MKLKNLIAAAVIGAAYAAMTMLLAPISYNALQFRLSEALCILPYFFPPAAWGLYFGCVIANLMSAAGLPDIVFGSLATLLAGLCTARLGQRARAGADNLASRLLACAMPVLFNGPIVGAVLAWAFMPGNFWLGAAVFGLQVALGEAVVMFGVGLPLMQLLPNLRFVRKLYQP